MIYLDNAATTRTEPDVVEAMMPYFSEFYGNPSAYYSFANKSWAAVENSREVIAEFIGADPSEIIFTSGGSEADNMALHMGTARRLVTSAIEHKAILNTGVLSGYIPRPVNSDGVVQIGDIVDDDLVSVMMANNELGTIQPIKEIAMKCREREGVLFHTDAVQAFGHIPINVKELGVDMMSVSAHKMGGPKGIGFLYVARDVPVFPLIHGGGQESGRRARTENVPAIVGFAKAVEIAKANMEARYHKTKEIRDFFESQIEWIRGAKINGINAERLPGHSSVTFHGIRAEEMLEFLNMYGICASSGSACNTGDEEPSHVLKAIGLTDDEANSTLRFTMNHENTIDEMRIVVDKIKDFLVIRGVTIH